MRLRLVLAAIVLIVVAAVALGTVYVRPPTYVRQTTLEGEEETWHMLGAMTAHGALVLEVAVQDERDALAIARQLVEPVRSDNYLEILIHFYPMGQTGQHRAVRRVLWTPGGGFEETVYER